MNKSLYQDKHPKTSLKGTGYANKDKAIQTFKLIKNYLKNKECIDIFCRL